MKLQQCHDMQCRSVTQLLILILVARLLIFDSNSSMLRLYPLDQRSLSFPTVRMYVIVIFMS